MSQVSKYKLSKKAESQLVDTLILVFIAIGKKEEMVGFFNAFFTNTERLMLAKRLATIILLTEGLSDTEIANSLHVTRATVAKARYYYEARGQGFKGALAKVEAEKQLQEAKKLMVSLARYAVRAAGGHVKPGILD